MHRVVVVCTCLIAVACGSERAPAPPEAPPATEEGSAPAPAALATEEPETAESTPTPDPEAREELVDAHYPFFAVATPRGIFVHVRAIEDGHEDDQEVVLGGELEEMFLTGSDEQLGFVIVDPSPVRLAGETTWEVFDGATRLCAAEATALVVAATVRAPDDDLACFPIPVRPQPVDPEERAPLSRALDSNTNHFGVYAQLSSADCVSAVAEGPAMAWARPRDDRAPAVARFGSVDRASAASVTERANRWTRGLARVRAAQAEESRRPLLRGLDRRVFTASLGDARWTSVYLGIGDMIMADADEHFVWDLWRGEGSTRTLVHSQFNDRNDTSSRSVTPLWIGDVDDDGFVDLAAATDRYNRHVVWFEIRGSELRERREMIVQAYCPT